MKVTAGGAAALAVTGFALCYACPSVGYMTYIKLLMCVGLPSYVGYIAAPILVGLCYMYLPWTKWIPGWGYCCKQDTSSGDNAPPEGAPADDISSAAGSKGDGFLANLWKKIQTYVICGGGLVVGGGVLYYWCGTGEGQSSSSASGIDINAKGICEGNGKLCKLPKKKRETYRYSRRDASRYYPQRDSIWT